MKMDTDKNEAKKLHELDEKQQAKIAGGNGTRTQWRYQYSKAEYERAGIECCCNADDSECQFRFMESHGLRYILSEDFANEIVLKHLGRT